MAQKETLLTPPENSDRVFNLNGVLHDSFPEPLSMYARAHMYGDGVFESIRMFRSEVPLWQYHYERLMAGLRKLSVTLPGGAGPEELLREIHKTASGNARIRLLVCRKTGGLYLPDHSEGLFMITADPSPDAFFPVHENGLTVGLSTKIQVPVDYYSGIKSLSAIRYVHAAQEARERNLDDVLLLNSRRNICESSNSSIIWIENGHYFTPPEGDGQVHGVFLRFLRETLYKSGISVTEKPCTFASLLQANEILLTNAVTGIRWVQQLDAATKTGLYAKLLTGIVNSQLSL